MTKNFQTVAVLVLVALNFLAFSTVLAAETEYGRDDYDQEQKDEREGRRD